MVLLVLPELDLPCEAPAGVFDGCVVAPRGIRGLGAQVERVAGVIDRLSPEVLVLNDSPYAMASLPFIRHSIVRIPVLHSVSPDEVELALSQGQWWDRAAAVSEFVKQAAARTCSEPRVSVCALGVPLPTPREQRPSYDNQRPLEIISVGRVVVHQKRLDRVPVIAGRLAERGIAFRWTVLGDGEYLPRLCREVQRLGLAGCFRFSGAVAPSEVANALATAEAFVLPSDCEGLPQALLEAMAQGVVPVVSRIPGSTTGLVETDHCGYLCRPSEPGEFADALAELACHRELCGELGRRAAAHVAQNLSLDAFTERFLALVAEARVQALARPAPLRSRQALLNPSALGCLGFWRNLRYQSLGRLKRRFVKRWVEAFVERRAPLSAA